MAKSALKPGVARCCVAMAACLLVVPRLISAEAAPESRFLELEAEISVRGFGVGLDVAVDPPGQLYLSSESRGGIWKLAQDGSTWESLIPQEPGSDLPRHPEAIIADGSGNLWVADPDRHRVVVIGPRGQLVRTYQDGAHVLRKPAQLSQADASHMAVWDADQGALILLSMNAPAVSALPPVAGIDYCIAADPVTTYCVGTDRKRLVKQRNGRVGSTWTPGGPYARIGDLATARGGEIYLTDTSGRHIFAVTPDLKSAVRFRLYESLLQTPTRLAVAGERLWLLDEGRQTVMRFRLRTAETAWEHALLGKEYLALSHYQAALEELHRAEGLGLRHPELTIHTGMALYGLGRYQDALAAWDREPHTRNGQALLRFWSGNALFRLGRYKEAAAAYAMVPKGDREYLRARFNLAQSHLALGENKLAKNELLDLIALQPTNDFAQVSLARALIGLGELQQAKDLLVKVAEPSPAAGAARYHLGHLQLMQGDVRAALPLLEQAAKQGPYFRAAMGDLIEASRRLGDTKRAQLYQQRLESLQGDTSSLDAFILEDES